MCAKVFVMLFIIEGRKNERKRGRKEERKRGGKKKNWKEPDIH